MRAGVPFSLRAREDTWPCDTRISAYQYVTRLRFGFRKDYAGEVVARRAGFARGTIYRELNRGATSRGYDAETAQPQHASRDLARAPWARRRLTSKSRRGRCR